MEPKFSKADYVATRIYHDRSSASSALSLNAYIYSTSSIQERLMQNKGETGQERRARLERKMAEIERRMDGKSKHG
jgi:hypothetical protein